MALDWAVVRGVVGAVDWGVGVTFGFMISGTADGVGTDTFIKFYE